MVYFGVQSEMKPQACMKHQTGSCVMVSRTCHRDTAPHEGSGGPRPPSELWSQSSPGAVASAQLLRMVRPAFPEK